MWSKTEDRPELCPYYFYEKMNFLLVICTESKYSSRLCKKDAEEMHLKFIKIVLAIFLIKEM